MRKLLAAAALFLAACGCNGLGPQRVPPPCTGSAGAGQPYYQPAAGGGAAVGTGAGAGWNAPGANAGVAAAPTAAPATAAVPTPTVPAATAAPSLAPTGLAAPTPATTQDSPEDLAWARPGAAPMIPSQAAPGSLGAQQAAAAAPSLSGAAPAATTVPAPATAAATPGAFQPAGTVRPVQPPVNGYAEETPALPLRGMDSSASGQAVGTGVPAQPAAQPVAAVAPTSWSGAPANQPTAATTSTASGAPAGGPAGRYGYLPDYTQLAGRLEYEQATGRWKLRYIPYDAPTNQIDQYGGSVVLANSGQMTGLRAGDYVRVAGRLGGEATGSADFAGSYTVTQVYAVQ